MAEKKRRPPEKGDLLLAYRDKGGITYAVSPELDADPVRLRDVLWSLSQSFADHISALTEMLDKSEKD